MRCPIFILFFFLYSITNACAIDNATADSIGVLPRGTTHFDIYRGNIILDGILNDTVSIKALLDTGAWGIAVPVKYKTSKEPESDIWPPKDKEHFRVGDCEQNAIATYTTEQSQFLKWFKGECVLLGWDFFEGKILEISYSGKYIRILDRKNLQNLKGYDCVNFKEKGKRLLIPVLIVVQEKKIEGDCWIDTGLNGSLFFTHNIPALYSLDTGKSRLGTAKGLDQKASKLNVLMADSISIGHNSITHRDVLFTDEAWSVFKENDMYIGLIGNQFFHDFSIIFDFQEKKLYMRPERGN